MNHNNKVILPAETRGSILFLPSITGLRYMNDHYGDYSQL